MTRKIKDFVIVLLVLLNLIVFISGGKSSSSSSEDPDPTGSSPPGVSALGHPNSAPLHAQKYDKYSSYYQPQPSNSANYYSAYGYPSNFPYGYHSTPYVPEYERNGKDFSTRASSTIPMAAPNFGYNSKEGPGPEFGGLAMASGGNHGHGHGHGHGWGWGKGYQGSKVDTSAIGLLGLIGLLSLLTSVLNSLTTTAAATTTTMMMAMGGRRKRSVVVPDEDKAEASGSQRTEGSSVSSRMSLMVLPQLNVIAHARDGRIPLECTHREVCIANSLFVKELGTYGRSVGNLMSSAITKLLKEADQTGSIVKHLSKASLTGRNGGDCLVIYPLCEALERRSQPLPLLMPPEHLEQLTVQNNGQQLPRSSSH